MIPADHLTLYERLANTEGDVLGSSMLELIAEIRLLQQREPTHDEMQILLGDRDEVPQGASYPTGWPTIRRCRHCQTPVAGGPTVCTNCVWQQELDAALKALGDASLTSGATVSRLVTEREAERAHHLAEISRVQAERDRLAAMVENAAPVMLTVMALFGDEADVAGLQEVGAWYLETEIDHLAIWLDAEKRRNARASEPPAFVGSVDELAAKLNAEDRERGDG